MKWLGEYVWPWKPNVWAGRAMRKWKPIETTQSGAWQIPVSPDLLVYFLNMEISDEIFQFNVNISRDNVFTIV